LVADETYSGRRFAELDVGPGIVMRKTASASGPVYSDAAPEPADGGGSALCERPPHDASDVATAHASTEERTLEASRVMGTIPQPRAG
jgi:hypothetical protein